MRQNPGQRWCQRRRARGLLLDRLLLDRLDLDRLDFDRLDLGLK